MFHRPGNDKNNRKKNAHKARADATLVNGQQATTPSPSLSPADNSSNNATNTGGEMGRAHELPVDINAKKVESSISLAASTPKTPANKEVESSKIEFSFTKEQTKKLAAGFEEDCFVLSGLYLKQDKFDDAITICQQAELNQASSDRVYLNHALAYVGKADSKKALIYFGKAIEKNPRNIDIYYWRAGVYSSQSSPLFEMAANDFTAIIKIDPQQVKAYYRRADIYNKLEKFHEAQADCATAISIIQKNYSATPPLTKDTKDKQSEMSRAKAAANYASHTFCVLAETNIGLKAYLCAIAACDAAKFEHLKRDKNDPDYKTELARINFWSAYAHYALGSSEQAEQLRAEANSLDPENASVFSKNYIEAKTLYEESILVFIESEPKSDHMSNEFAIQMGARITLLRKHIENLETIIKRDRPSDPDHYYDTILLAKLYAGCPITYKYLHGNSGISTKEIDCMRIKIAAKIYLEVLSKAMASAQSCILKVQSAKEGATSVILNPLILNNNAGQIFITSPGTLFNSQSTKINNSSKQEPLLLQAAYALSNATSITAVLSISTLGVRSLHARQLFCNELREALVMNLEFFFKVVGPLNRGTEQSAELIEHVLKHPQDNIFRLLGLSEKFAMKMNKEILTASKSGLTK